MEEGGIVPPHSVLAPGTALRLLRSRALPSAQVRGIVVAKKGLSNRTKQRGVMRKHASARLFDRSCPVATRDPSRWGQLGSVRGCGGLGQQWPRPAARRVGWSGPDGEEFAPDTSASALSRYRAELLTIIVSGTLRRNVLGAIASEKNDCNFPQRSDDNRDESRRETTASTQGSLRPTNRKDTRLTPGAIVTRKPRGSRFLLDKLFQERSETPKQFGTKRAGRAIRQRVPLCDLLGWS